MTGDRFAERRAAPIDHGRPVRLSPLVRRLTQENPGPFTGPGTNTYLVGESALFILEPGEDRGDDHLDRIVAAVGAAPVAAVLPSHGHPDHWSLAPRLAERLGAPVGFFGTHPGFRTDRILRDGDVLEAGGVRLEVLHTPGHTRDHVSFLLARERALFPGDHVMAWSTAIIAPPEGDLTQYLDSLSRLIQVPNLAVLYPAHGLAILNPYERMRELLAHRQERTRQALASLERGPATLANLVKEIYADTDPALHGAAAHSLLAHLLALEANGLVERPPQDRGEEAEAIWRLTGRPRSRS